MKSFVERRRGASLGLNFRPLALLRLEPSDIPDTFPILGEDQHRDRAVSKLGIDASVQKRVLSREYPVFHLTLLQVTGRGQTVTTVISRRAQEPAR